MEQAAPPPPPEVPKVNGGVVNGAQDDSDSDSDVSVEMADFDVENGTDPADIYQRTN